MAEVNQWQVLGIDPTTDLKTIKRAYSKKLKQWKPDIDPEGFERLRYCYEVAQYQAKQAQAAEAEAAQASPQQEQAPPTQEKVTAEDIGEPLQLTPSHQEERSSHQEPQASATHPEAQVDSDGLNPASVQEPVQESAQAPLQTSEQDATSEVVEIPAPQIQEQTQEPTQEQAQLNEREQAVVDLLEEAKSIIANGERRNQLAEWEAFVEHELCYDLNYRRYIGQALFHYCLQARLASKKRIYQSEVLDFLDSEFGWADDAQIQARYTEQDYYLLVSRPAPPKPEPRILRANRGQRIKASIIDLLMVAIATVALFIGLIAFETQFPALRILNEREHGGIFWWVFLAIHLLYHFGMDLKTEKGTLGKRAQHILQLDHNLKPPSQKALFMRNLQKYLLMFMVVAFSTVVSTYDEGGVLTFYGFFVFVAMAVYLHNKLDKLQLVTVEVVA